MLGVIAFPDLRSDSADFMADLQQNVVNASGPISRVLSLDDHLSRTSVARRLKHATRTYGGPPCRVPICACSGWGFPSRAVADALVRSYRTVSAFLPQLLPRRVFAGEFSFLWHFPSGRPAQPLAGILPYGARTFLTPKCAIVWPARVWYSSKPWAACARETRSSAKFTNRSAIRVSCSAKRCASSGGLERAP